MWICILRSVFLKSHKIFLALELANYYYSFSLVMVLSVWLTNTYWRNETLHQYVLVRIDVTEGVFGYKCIKQYITWDCDFVIYLIITSSFGINVEFSWSVRGSSKTVITKTVITSSIWRNEWLFSKRCFEKSEALKSPYAFGITIFLFVPHISYYSLSI
jgi:hypothetical protein